VPDLKNVCENASHAYDYLVKEKLIKPEQIILYGESLGGAISIELAAVRKARALIIHAAFLSLRNIAVERMPILTMYPSWLFPEPSLDSGTTLAKLKVPILIIHGDNDPVVPYHHAEALFKQAGEPKTLVRLTSFAHRDLVAEQRTKFHEEIKKFLEELEH
jgi:hypothetical protein